MKIKFLGAHNTESSQTKYISLLVDDVLALDAGGLTSSLTFQEQIRIRSILLTHGHYDHIRDIPALAINLYLRRLSVDVYTHQAVYDILVQHFLNHEVYSDFHKSKPESQASLNFRIIEAGKQFSLGPYQIIPIPVKHSIPSMGYQIMSQTGRSFFYSGDTGNELSSVWNAISPQVLIIEVTSCDQWIEYSKQHGHLTPALLKTELAAFRNIKGYLPRVIAVHMNPLDESNIRTELTEIASQLGASIEVAYEGMTIDW